MNNNASIDTQVQGAPLSVAVTPQHLAVPDGWKLAPVEPTPEIIAGAAIASWPTATLADIDLARQAAPLVLMQMDMAPGTTVDALAGMLATMAPAYRAMLAAAPKYSPLPAAAPQVVADERAAALADQDQVPYLIYFDDADRKPEMVIGELRAQYRFKQISGSWNAHLFVKIASNSQDDKYPCVTLTAQVQPQEPEAAQQNGGLVRAALIDLLALEHHTFAGVSTFDAQSDCRVRFARARQALAAPVQPMAVLDGWKLVPVRMTPDMKSILKEAAPKWNAESIYGNLLEAAPAAPAAQGDAKDTCAEMRALCSSCGGTGDVHRADGEWLGECTCIHGQAQRREQQAHGAHPAPCARSCEAPAFQSQVRERDARIAQLEAQLVRRRTPLSPETQQAIAATPAGLVFMNDGAEPGSGELDYPTCGGSGHAADVAARSTP